MFGGVKIMTRVSQVQEVTQLVQRGLENRFMWGLLERRVKVVERGCQCSGKRVCNRKCSEVDRKCSAV